MNIDFPALNAGLNALAGVLLVVGYVLIRLRRPWLHMACMLGAVGVSAVFLGCYLYYHLVVKGGTPTRFADQAPGAPEWMHWLYAGILLSHTLLATITLPLAVTTFVLALRQRWSAHRALARWTLPIWLYVSATGVVIYWLLYHAYGPAS